MNTDTDINDMLTTFYDMVHAIFDECVPRSTIKTSKKPIWFNNHLVKLENIRNLKITDPDADTTEFSNAKTQFDEMNKQRYSSYIKQVAEKTKNDSKYLWKYVSGRRKSNTFPNTVEYENSIASNDADKA